MCAYVREREDLVMSLHSSSVSCVSSSASVGHGRKEAGAAAVLLLWALVGNRYDAALFDCIEEICIELQGFYESGVLAA